MRLIASDAFITMPWKNGGGITHEIAREDPGGRLLWRLSLAEVATDGPFSPFPGLMRVLTVIDGAGMVLDGADAHPGTRPEGQAEGQPEGQPDAAPGGTGGGKGPPDSGIGGSLTARPFAPVRFRGDVPVAARLVAGPVRDLNLIFDPTRLDGGVSVADGPFRLSRKLAAVYAVTAGVVALAAGTGPATHTGGDRGTAAELAAGSVALDADGIALAPGARAILVFLRPI